MRFHQLLSLIKKEPVFSSGFLQAGNSDKAAIARQLSRWKKEGRIVQLRRGLYMLGPDQQSRHPHLFAIANRLRAGSYISLHSALAFYSLIPEHVPVITSVFAGRPGLLDTPAGSFQFRHLHPRLLFGYEHTDLGNGENAFIARPEKALLDLIHLTPGADNLDYLHELRLQNLELFDLNRLKEYAGLGHLKKWLRAAALVETIIMRG